MRVILLLILAFLGTYVLAQDIEEKEFPRFGVSVSSGYSFAIFKDYTHDDFYLRSRELTERKSEYINYGTGAFISLTGEMNFNSRYTLLIQYNFRLPSEISTITFFRFDGFSFEHKYQAQISSFGLGGSWKHSLRKFDISIAALANFAFSAKARVQSLQIERNVDRFENEYVDFFLPTLNISAGIGYNASPYLHIGIKGSLHLGYFKPDKRTVRAFTSNGVDLLHTVSRSVRETYYKKDFVSERPIDRSKPSVVDVFTISMMTFSPVLELTYNFK